MNTPETDAESCYPDSNLGECVCADFARKLERERDEARELLASEKITRNHIIQRGIEMQKELREWQTLRSWGGTPEHIHGFIRGQQSRIQHLERERDEAREENAKLRDIAERAINYLDQSYRDGFADEASDLRYEIEQLKDETK